MKITDNMLIRIEKDPENPHDGETLYIRESEPDFSNIIEEDDNGLMWFIPEDAKNNNEIDGVKIEAFNSYWINHKGDLYKAIASKTGDNIEDIKRVIEPYFRK